MTAFDYSFVILFRVLLVFSIPSEFWAAVVELLEVPDQVRVFINPLLGSLCITIIEALAESRKRSKQPSSDVEHTPAWHYPLKIFVGWVGGSYSVDFLSPIFKAEAATLSFYGGAAGYGLISLVVALILKKIDTDSKPEQP